MITIKVMTKNQEYCGFQGWQQTEKMMTCQVLSTNIIISYITWYMNTFWVRYFYFVDKLPWNLKKELNNFQFFFSWNDQTKLEISKIYDRSSGKYVRSCLMTECYFDPLLFILGLSTLSQLKSVSVWQINTTSIFRHRLRPGPESGPCTWEKTDPLNSGTLQKTRPQGLKCCHLSHVMWKIMLKWFIFILKEGVHKASFLCK